MNVCGYRALALAALAVATVGLGLMLAGDVGAKPNHCRKDCKQDTKSCLTLVPKNKDCRGIKAVKKACQKLNAEQRRTCHSLVSLCKQHNPDILGLCLLGSPGSSFRKCNPESLILFPPIARCFRFVKAER